MTEVPEHLRKRAEEARAKAAAKKAGGGEAAPAAEAPADAAADTPAAGSYGVGERAFNSSRYARRHCRASGCSGSVVSIVTALAVSRRSTSAMAVTSRWRCRADRGARVPRARSSLRRSSTACSDLPRAVRCATLTLASPSAGRSSTRPSASSPRNRRLARPESRPNRARSRRTSSPRAPISHSMRAAPSERPRVR